MGHKSSDPGSDSEDSDRQLRNKTRRNKKNSNKISSDGGLQFDVRRHRNKNRINPEEGQVEMDYRKKSSDPGSDSEDSDRRLRTKTRRNKKNSNKISSDGGLQFDVRRDRNNNRINPEEGQVEMDYRKPPVRTAVLLMNLCCKGCTERISTTVTNSAGFRLLSIGKQAITVEGPNIEDLADLLASKFKRPVEIAPAEGGSGGEKDTVRRGGDGATKVAGKELDGNKSDKPPVRTAKLTMAVPCVCDGHLRQIRKSVTKTKGCHSCKVSRDDVEKAVVNVTGTMDVNALKKKLEKKFMTSV